MTQYNTIPYCTILSVLSYPIPYYIVQSSTLYSPLSHSHIQTRHHTNAKQSTGLQRHFSMKISLLPLLLSPLLLSPPLPLLVVVCCSLVSMHAILIQYIHTHTYTYTHTLTHARTQHSLHIPLHARTHTHLHTYTRAHTLTHTTYPYTHHIPLHTHAHTGATGFLGTFLLLELLRQQPLCDVYCLVRIKVCMYVCVYVCMNFCDNNRSVMCIVLYMQRYVCVCMCMCVCVCVCDRGRGDLVYLICI